MALTGKIVQQVEIKCGGNLLHDIIKSRPNDIALMSPDKIQRCDLISGEWGAVGSVICWHFIHDGKTDTAKELIEAIDEETYKIVLKVIDGDVLKAYKVITLAVHVELKGDKQLAVWTLDFEKVNANIPDPTPYVDLLCAITKDMDAHLHK